MPRDFSLVVAARFLFSFAVQIQAVVIGWQVYDLTHDPLYLGLIGLAEAIPALTLALISGYVVDRGNPLKIYRNVILLSLCSAALLFGLSTGMINIPEQSKLPWIYLAALITGTARGFSGPALNSLIPRLVERKVLHITSAWVTSAFHFASVAGPALGGILYAWAGPKLPYGMGCTLLLISIGCLAGVRHKIALNLKPETQPIFERLTSGIRFVFGHQLLISALTLDMFAVLFGGATALLPIFAGEILSIGPTGLGILRAAPAAGALIASLLLVRFPVSHGAGKTLLSCITGFGLCMIGFGLSRDFTLSLIFLVMSGALDSVSMVIRQAIVQLCSPDEMRGRVAAVNSFFIGSSNELGAFESGVAAKLLGTVTAVVFGGCVTLVSVAVAGVRAPKLRAMDLSKL